MDYEKKDFRKIYEDLVKSDWFKRAYHNKSLGECPFDIPELNESEDEGMYARVTGRYTRFEKYYLRALGETEANKALKQCEEEELWIKNLLEKQKDLDKMIVVSPEVWDKAIADAYENGKKEGEKQKEQKPDMLQNAFDKSKKDYTLEEKSKASDYAESILPTSIIYGESEEEYKLHTIIEAAFIAGQKEQKPTWSEEDEKILNELLDHCNTKNATWYNWLKSLPERFNLQPKQEWSENGEKILDSLIRLYGGEYSAKAWPWSDGVITYGDVVNFLKSLRPQPHWKPSKEQITAIEAAYSVLNSHDTWGEDEHLPTIMSLINDLQKLL